MPTTHHSAWLVDKGRNSLRGNQMKATQLLHNLGQSLWLDNITRDLINTGTLNRYIDELSVTGLTSNPTIFDHAIKNSTAYDAAIRTKLDEGKSGEKLFFELALEDLTRAADLFRPTFDRTNGVDGWVSLEVSPLLAHDTASTLTAAKSLHARAGRPNLLIKIPGTKEGLPAIEESIFAGVPINVTLLFSREHYIAAAEAFLRGIERRIDAGLKSDIGSVASVFVSRWDAAVAGKVPAVLNNKLGIAIAKRTYKAYRELLGSPRWERIYNAGARPQRLLWASTGTKDPKAPDVLYIKALAAPFTVNTMPEGTLKALADHGDLSEIMSADGGDCEAVLDWFAAAGIDIDDLAAKLQDDGAKSFVSSWNDLMEVLASGQKQSREFPSGPKLTPRQMVAGVKKLASDWKYDSISIGYPGVVMGNRPVADPYNLGQGWTGFDFEAAFTRPVKVINDAAMQALGSYKHGKMLFLGLGTGLGSAMVVDGIVEPMELGHLPYRRRTFEDYVGIAGRARLGQRKWEQAVKDVIARLIAALEPEEVVLGGGNVKNLKNLPPSCRTGDNANAFVGGFRVCEKTDRANLSKSKG